VEPAHARYDGHSEWYDETFGAFSYEEETAFLRERLGAGRGQICLDVACGTGLHGRTVVEAGYRAVGFDISADQIRFARRRLDAAVRADARRLPLPDGAVALALGMFFHTDVADFAAVVRDVARCLRPGGRFIYVGLHPCFIGPFVNRMNEPGDGALRFVPGYGDVGWADRGSGDGSGVGGRVGFHHKTLAGFLGAIAGAGLDIRELREFAGGGVVLPRNLAVVAVKAGATGASGASDVTGGSGASGASDVTGATGASGASDVTGGSGAAGRSGAAGGSGVTGRLGGGP
jgi:SAM-dependent methyltransferase